jgi:hypothetical protein
MHRSDFRVSLPRQFGVQLVDQAAKAGKQQ